MLGDVESRVVRGVGEEREKEISKREIKEAMKRLKDGKAAGINEILGKVWKYEGEEVWKNGYGISVTGWKRKDGQKAGRRGDC